MSKLVPFVVLLAASSASATGIGDTIADFERAWNKGFRKVFPMSVMLGTSEQAAVSYSTGVLSYSFGKPPRVGRIDANTAGLFGAPPRKNATAEQFFQGVRALIPSDARLMVTYRKLERTDPAAPWRKEIYSFKSAWLAGLPGAKDSFAYDREGNGSPLGTFMMIVNYDIDTPERVSNFIIVLGTPGEADRDGLVKVTSRRFN